jgi:hypothetical protein
MLEEKDIRERIQNFVASHQAEHATNVMDFKVSKNVHGGNGFQIYNHGTIWNKDRAQVNASGVVMTPIVNSIVYRFTENPFDFRAADAETPLPYEVDWTELKFQLGNALRDAVQDGISYILTYKKDGRIRFSRLDNFNVMYGTCEYSNGKDCKEAIYVDKRDTGKKQRKSMMGIAFETVLDLAATEIPVLTYYFLENGECHQVKLEADEIADYTVQPIGALPIARIYGKEVPIDYRKNWRGIYYCVKDILRTMDLEQSLIQERICTAPNHQYWVAEESVGNNVEQFGKSNDIPTFSKTYKAFNPNNPGVSLPPPQRNDLSTNIADLTQSYSLHNEIVNQGLGQIAGDDKGNETAEAVLLRRENKDTATNDLIKNLLDSAHAITDIVEEFIERKVSVASDIFEKAKKNEELQKIIALTQFISQNKVAYSATPVLISKLDVDEKTKQVLLQLLSQEKEQADASSQEIELLKMENQQLRSDKEAQVVAAQINREAQMASKAMDAQIKQEEFRLKWAELGMKQEGETIKLAQEGQKMQDDLETKIADLQIKGFNAGVQSVN